MSVPLVFLVDRFNNNIAALPDAEVANIVWKLNDIGTASIAVPTLSAPGSVIELMKTEWQIWIGGNLEWQGYAESVTGNSQLMTYTLADLLGYFKYRFVSNTSLDYSNSGAGLDQITIMLDFIAAMQSGTNQSFNIAQGSVSTSGIIRLRQYDRAQHQNAIDILKEFPTLTQGCDYSVECTDPGTTTPHRVFVPWYPQKGAPPTAPKSQYALVWGKNILTFNSFAEDGTKLCTLDYMTGGSDGVGGKFENYYEDTTASNYYGQFQAITADGSELDPQWLLSKANQEVDNRNRPVSTPTIVMASVSGEELVHNLKVGDCVPVYVNEGRIKINGIFRISQAQYNGDTTYQLLMAPVPVVINGGYTEPNVQVTASSLILTIPGGGAFDASINVGDTVGDTTGLFTYIPSGAVVASINGPRTQITLNTGHAGLVTSAQAITFGGTFSSYGTEPTPIVGPIL